MSDVKKDYFFYCRMIEMEYFDSSEDGKDEENDENLIKVK